jgi:hypothetical protein
MDLQPRETIILFIRRAEETRETYMVGIRKTKTSFGPGHDVEVEAAQEQISALGKFENLAQAIGAASEKLRELTSKAASV